ncbi:MAG: hypothetical protein NTW50_00260 [Candidatus Berkelbacteria bacterium]|nr:hypothetical protein [Candidatus Berkelbacteria bacterium]
MVTTVLVQILLIVLIVAVVCLIAVLWRCFDILDDIKKITQTVAKRVLEMDQKVDELKATLSGWRDTVSGFVYSLGIVKSIKHFVENINKKGETDGE